MYSPKHSFLQFADCNAITAIDNCIDNPKYKLAFQNLDVIVFQFIYSGSISFDLLDSVGGVVATNVGVVTELEGEYKKVSFTVPSILKGCYKLRVNSFQSNFCGLSIEDICNSPIASICSLGASPTVLACSNEFYIGSDLCFSELVRYQNLDDAFGFYYFNDFYNQIRLPIQVRFPEFKLSSEIYRKSDGSYLKVSSDSEKQFDLDTDYIDIDMHEKISILLLHDFIQIIGKSEYICNEPYEVDYRNKVNTELNLFKGKSKLIETPYNTINPKYN